MDSSSTTTNSTSTPPLSSSTVPTSVGDQQKGGGDGGGGGGTTTNSDNQQPSNNNNNNNNTTNNNKRKRKSNKWAWVKKAKEKKRLLASTTTTTTQPTTTTTTDDNHDHNHNGNANTTDHEQQQPSSITTEKTPDQSPKKPKPNRWRNRGTNGYSDLKDTPHAGSFACSAMRTLFDVSLGSPYNNNNNNHQSDVLDSTIASSETTTTNNNTNQNENENEKDTTTTNTNPLKLPKRKIALLLGYIGTSYSGMQINESQNTIQAVLELGLYQAGFLTHSNFGFPAKYGWSNAARTDKGVHACAQVCSTKVVLPTDVVADETVLMMKPATGSSSSEEKEKEMKVQDPKQTILEEKDTQRWEDRVRERLNEVLPNDIRVLDVVRVTKSFCAKTGRDRVRYRYTFPSYLLNQWDDEIHRAVVAGKTESNTNTEEAEAEAEDDDDGTTTNTTSSKKNETSFHVTSQQIESLRSILGTYRSTPSRLALLQTALALYPGTHSFHNYTSGKTSSDPSAIRYVHSVELERTPTVDAYGVEWLSVEIVGQSFLLHQIRKMMCMATDVARGLVDLDEMEASLVREPKTQKKKLMKKGPVEFGEGGERGMDDDVKNKGFERKAIRVNVNVAPAQGLFLDMSYYDNYNRKNATHDPLEWDVNRNNERKDKGRGCGNEGTKRWKEFKDNVVTKHIVEEEQKEGNFVRYMVQRWRRQTQK